MARTVTIDVHAIFGAPGTGKTRYLSELITELVKETPNIAVLSFTKMAAKTLAARIDVDVRTVATLHSLVFNYFNLKKKQIADSARFENFAGQDVVRQFFPVYQYWRAYNGRIPFDQCFSQFNSYLPFDQALYIKDTYEAWKIHNGYIDFFDLLLMGVGKIQKFDYVIVDEAQDLSYIQMDLIETLVKPTGTIYMAGDDDQSIYGFTGSDPKILIDQSNKTVLEQSYRLPETVYDMTQHFARSMIRSRQDKKFRHRGKRGDVIFYNHINPDLWFRYDKFTVLCRDNFILEDVKQELASLSIPFSVKSPNVRSPFDGLLANLIRAINNKDMEFIRKKKKYLRDSVPLDSIRETTHWKDVFNLSMFNPLTVEYLMNIGNGVFGEPRVTVSTIHSFKGGEDDNVILIAEVNDRSAELFYKPMEEAEYRVWYTAMTRARKNLVIVGNNDFLIRGGIYRDNFK